jgi:type II secretory pathway predicted ATPase ExeA
MPADSFGLRKQPFGTTAHAGNLIRNRPQQDGLRFLRQALDDRRGAAWVHGAKESGKTSLALSLLKETQDKMAVALVDGNGLYASQLLTTILDQFGYDVSLGSTDELVNMLTVFLVQQTRAGNTPLLIVDNVHRMYPGALNVLCRLASMTARDRYALRLVFFSEGDCKHMIASQNMKPVAERLVGSSALDAFNSKESALYLYAKLRAAGATRPDDIFPTDLCDALHEASGGLPGRLDSLADAVLEQSDGLPIRLDRIDHPDLAVRRRDAPRFIVTRSGSTLLDVELLESRVLVGRSEICDIRLDDQFVSKQHALIVWNSNAVLLIDLNSSNGTYVNSRRIKTRVLRNDDVISLGDHRIKMIYPDAGSRTDFEDLDVADTAAMQNIAGALGKRSLRRLPLRVLHAQDPDCA